jgi:hypothetical protein
MAVVADVLLSILAHVFFAFTSFSFLDVDDLSNFFNLFLFVLSRSLVKLCNSRSRANAVIVITFLITCNLAQSAI